MPGQGHEMTPLQPRDHHVKTNEAFPVRKLVQDGEGHVIGPALNMGKSSSSRCKLEVKGNLASAM